tara:strand:+ start:935 stop:2977 length:2043 start_codon:yes stop_codon:yes gene_type:complete
MVDQAPIDIAKVSRFVEGLRARGEPEAEVQAFLRSKGITPDQLVASQELTAGTGQEPTFNPNREAGLLTRFATGLRQSPQGRASLAESKFPGEGLPSFVSPEGDVFLRDKGEVFPLDKEGFTAGDIADFSGDILQGAAALKGRPNIHSQAAIGGLSQLGRQGINELLPGQENLGTAERLGLAGLDTALGGGAQFITNKVMSGARKLRPNMLQRLARAADNSAEGARGRRLERRAGQVFTAGQRTGSRSLLTLEGLARQHPASSDPVALGDLRRLDSAFKFLDRTMDAISPGAGGLASVGGSVSRAFDAAMTSALAVRRRVARRDFAILDQAAGGANIIGIDGTLDALGALIKKHDVPGGGDATAKLVAQLRNVEKDLFEKFDPGQISGTEMQRLLQIYGAASKGKGQVFADLDSAQQRQITGEIFTALQSDLDAAAVKPGLSGDVSTALQNARNNYRKNSGFIDEVSASVLGKIFNQKINPTPEAVGKAMLNMDPTTLKISFGILDKADEGVAQQVKRLFIEDALIKGGRPVASNAPAKRAGEHGGFKVLTFVERLRQAPVWDVMTRKERFETATALRVFETLGNRGGTGGSQTAPLTFAAKVATSMLRLNLPGITEAIAGIIAPRFISKALMTPEGRKAIFDASTRPAESKAYKGAIVFLGALVADTQRELSSSLVEVQ